MISSTAASLRKRSLIPSENAPGEIHSLPPIAILAGMEYADDVNADDENEGAGYSYLQGPDFLSIDDSTGITSRYLRCFVCRIPLYAGHGRRRERRHRHPGMGRLSILPANDEENAPPLLDALPPFVFNEDDTSSFIVLDDYVEDADTPDEELEWLFIVSGE
ncbi:MAG: hypothetical protein U5N26_09125 [Candidatus Marinimicrobia bacterium]|nr:hypothetical protein [Candidatus Neomarinimicrobiota bacterium]